MHPCRGLLLLVSLLLVGGRAIRAEEGPAAPKAEPQLTLERVFGGPPIHAELPGWSWRPGHAELVRTRVHEKRRQLLALDPISGAERVLLDLTALHELVGATEGAGEDGIGRAGPSALLWSADGEAVCALVRGERVWVDLEAGTRRVLTQGGARRADVQLAPDDRHVSYVAGNDLWIVPIDGTSAPRVVKGTDPEVLNGVPDWVYPEELDLQHGAWWAPDGGRLALLRLDQRGVRRYDVPDSLDGRGDARRMWYPRAGERNPQAGLWVVGAAGPGEPVPVRLDLGQPAHEYVVRVAWTPDAARLIVVTLDRAQRQVRVRSQDPLTGAGTTLFEQQDAAWIDPPPTPRFVAPRAFLWRGAEDGTQRWWLARLNVAGDGVVGGISEETPAGFVAGEVLHAAFGVGAPSGTALDELVVTGCEVGSRRRGVWRRSGAGRLGRWLPELEQSLGAELCHDGTLALVRRSSALVPPVLEVRRVADGALVRTLAESSSPAFRALSLPRIEEGEVAVEGGKVLWRLWLPHVRTQGVRRPLIVTVYGGPGSRSVEDRFGGDFYWNALLIERGFAVLEADGRGTGGQGPAFERRVLRRLGILELDDQVAAVKAVAARDDVDASRVGIWGWSYGGTMAANALVRRSDVFQAGVAVAPVTDWRLYDTIYTERYMGLPAENAAGYQETSVVEHAAGLKGRLLLLHGLADDNVHPHNTLRLVEALVHAEKSTFAWQLYPNRGHGIEGAALDVHRRALEWFEAALRAE